MELTGPTPPGYIEERYKKRSAAISMTVFVILLIALVLPLFSYPTPPPGQEGILVNLGVIDLGEGDENAAASAQEVAEPTPPAAEELPPPAEEPIPEPEPVPEPLPEPEPEVAEPEPTPKPDPVPDPREELLAAQEAEAIALRKREARAKLEADKKREVERAAKAKRDAAQRAEAQRIAAEKAERAERQRQAELAAAAKAERERKAAALRASTADLFGGAQGSGDGKGRTGKPGNQGDPNGDPNASRLTGLSSGGAGDVGGGLEGRGVLASPKLTDNSQRRGRIRVAVCVGPDGRVSSARYTQMGSTSNDEVLKQLAINNAKGYRFSPSSAASQCGHISYEFVVQ